MMLRLCTLILLLIASEPLAWGQGKATGAKHAKPDATLSVDFDEPTEAEAADDAFYAQPIEQAFKNSPIASGLASGADAINRSVESLMDSLFYSLLDNEANLRIYDDEAWFTTGFSRDLYSTPSGAFVVVERIGLGPRYGKELWRVHDVPVSLGIDNTVEVLQIYLRTDGMRLAEQNDLSPTRRLINNWFGLLPAVAMLLPPSFNENELYDPLRQLETPFVFPLEVEGFYGMPVGSIRSYALSGGVRFPIDFGGMIDAATKSQLDRTGHLTESIPYSIFKTGSHRINVLRHGEHSAWVGLSEISRTGHAISPLVGAKYFVLKGALAAQAFDYKWVWQGVPVAVLPIDLNFEQAYADVFDQVYEYDLRNPAAQAAYLAAVRGDFVPSRSRYLDWKERDIDTGVVFHFARTADKTETLSTNGPNLAVYRRERQRRHSEAEIEITDQEGKFYVLEVNHDVSDKNWDILVGDEEQRVQQTLEMKVRRVLDNEQASNGFFYAFDTDEEPVRLLLNLSVQDRYIDVEEYNNYIEAVRYFTALPLSTVPKIGLRDAELLRERRRYAYFDEPGSAVSLHVPPTYLGRFGAQVSISFSSKQLKYILDTDENEMWRAFAQAYGQDEAVWSSPEERAGLSFQSTWFKPFLLYPLRLFNTRFASVDAIKEATSGVKELMALKGLARPADMIEAFYRLFDTDHPPQLTRALLNMSNMNEVPRRVTFSAQPKGKARAAIKTAFGKLNNLTFRDGPAFPEPGRYARAKTKLATFYLGRPRESEEKPAIARVQITTRVVPASVRSLPGPDEVNAKGALARDDKHVYVSMDVSRLRPGRRVKVYVRVEQAGRVKIGKLELAEQVIELTPTMTQSDNNLSTQTFEFFLTGPLSPLSSFLFDNAVSNGDQFLVTLGASDDGIVWTDERSVEFRYEKGRLGPPE